MKLKIIVAAALLALNSCAPAFAAQGESRWSISTNIPTWLLLGCANADIHYKIADRWCLQAGVKYNPFTYAAGSERQTHLRQLTPSLGVRYWFDRARNRWFLGAKLLASEYSVSYPRGGHFFDGELAGAGLFGGYEYPISERLSLSLGAGAAVAYHRTTFYGGPVCGRITDRKKGVALFPSDILVSLTIKL